MKSKPQAVKATPEELAYLSFWRQRGYHIGPNDPIPCNTMTPPTWERRHPIKGALIGSAVLVAVFFVLLKAWASSQGYPVL